MSNTLVRTILSTLAALGGFALGMVVLQFNERRSGGGDAKSAAPLGTERASDEPLALQAERAEEPGRGREAEGPTRIPSRGWKDILWRTWEEISADRLLLVAAGVVFYAMLAIVPTITAMVSLYGLFAKASTISGHLGFLAGLIPASAYDLISEQIVRIAANSDGKLTLAFAVALGIALWSANAGMKAIFDALNIIYDEDEKRGFIKLNLISLTFTLGAVVVFLLAIASVIVMPLVLAYLGFAAGQQAGFLPLLRWPVLFVVVMFGLSLLYRFGPSRRDAKWRWVSVGSAFAAFAWLAVSAAFSWYLSKFADYNATYGSLGAVMGLMMWLWLSTSVILVGAELNAEIEHQTAGDSTVGGGKPLGSRGATMADTVGAAQH
jgi:membrane protein